jgi:hypothetical protein
MGFASTVAICTALATMVLSTASTAKTTLGRLAAHNDELLAYGEPSSNNVLGLHRTGG